MTSEEARKMLKAKLDCLIRETSGTDIDCNNKNCDECNLCYEQGNMGEQKEALELAIKALEQEPFMNKPCVAHQICHEDKVKVLDKIRFEIELQREEVSKKHSEDEGLSNYYFGLNDGLKDARDVIDKYKAESEE